MKLNRYQTAVINAYCAGAFKYLLESTNWREDLKSSGDRLLTAILVDLATSEGCESRDEAMQRMLNYLGDVEMSFLVIQSLDSAEGKR